MERDELLRLLEQVARGGTSPEAAVRALADGYADVPGVARVDLDRVHRRGIPEVVFGERKSAAQVESIFRHLLEHGQDALVTRLDDDKARALKAAFPQGEHNALGRTFLCRARPFRDVGRGHVLVVCAGTSDLPVAEEAAATLDAMGHRVQRLVDVGVAGVHRLMAERARLDDAEVIIAVAGMEAALPSVIGGLCARPVIGVPTSVGYGAAFGGVAALLAMLNACSSGVTVVNIDNGFGAAFAAALYNRRKED
ncbi:MAG: nickel pincer cofactor biosynthesis protein LarB [Deltaproteobacteria bacterium]|nr:nickel pincer cofactor biosynthesis protein LarB [Deltaproteobacteria bacterium]